MSTAVQTTTPAETFRSKASERFHAVADMTLYDLLDEFLRLTKVVNAGLLPQGDDEYAAEYTDEAKVAAEERKLVLGASRARFGVGFNEYSGEL